MIFWMDFVLDDRFGPLLSIESEGRGAKEGADAVSVMEDGGRNLIQETGQEGWPARKAGDTSSEFNAAARRDAGVASAPQPSANRGRS